MPDSNCSIEEHLLALYGRAETREQILERMNCGVPENKWADLNAVLKEWPEQKEDVLPPAFPTLQKTALKADLTA